MLLNKNDNTYNVDKTFDYFTIKSLVIQSLEKVVREELNRHIASINLHELDIQEDEDIIANTSNNLFDDQDDDNKNYQHH